MNYTKEYFIQKFEAIPDEQWTVEEYENEETGACCAAGHCGFQKDMLNPEITALVKLFNFAEGKNTGTSAIFNINDGDMTPK